MWLDGGADSGSSEVGLACLAEVELPVGEFPVLELSEDDIACCVAENGTRIAAAGAANAENPSRELLDDPSFVNCCVALAFGAHYPVTEDEFVVHAACCYNDIAVGDLALEFQSYCTPWGPPTPPCLVPETGSSVEASRVS
jgi:hypothetical protein